MTNPINHYTNYRWEVIEQEVPGLLQSRIYIIDRSGKNSIVRIVEGRMELEELKEGVEVQPTFSLPFDAWAALKESIISKLPKEKDVETTSELKATKYHLEDMRNLVFSKKKA